MSIKECDSVDFMKAIGKPLHITMFFLLSQAQTSAKLVTPLIGETFTVKYIPSSY